MSFLDGDGREMIEPEFSLPGTRPKRVRRATARTMVDALMRSGSSLHSPLGSTLWVLLKACHEQKLHYDLQVRPGETFFIKVLR